MSECWFGFRVSCSGFRVLGLATGVGEWSRVQGSGFRVLGLANGVGEWFRVQGSGFRVLGLATGVGILVQSSVFLVSCSGFSDRDRNAVP